MRIQRIAGLDRGSLNRLCRLDSERPSLRVLLNGDQMAKQTPRKTEIST